MSASENLFARLLTWPGGGLDGEPLEPRSEAPAAERQGAHPECEEQAYSRLEDRERELELRILMSNWM